MKTLALLLALAAGGGEGKDRAPRKTLPLTVREAISLSLNHNLDVEVARYQPWIEDQNVYAALGPWDHVAYASASSGESLSQPSNTLIDATRPEAETANFTVGLRKSLPFGPRYDLSFSSRRLETNNPFAPFNPRWSQTARASLTLPLLQGAGTTANTSSLLIARHNRDMALDDFEKALSDSVFAVVQSYWDLVFAIEDERVKRQSLQVAEQLLSDNRARFERGLVARIDVTQADAGVAAQQEGILTAEAAVENAMDQLKRLVDPGLLTQEVGLAPMDAPKGLVTELEEAAAVERALAAAMARRPEIRRIRRQLLSQDVTIVRAENDLLPQVDLTGTASFDGTEDSFEGAGHNARTGDFRDVTVGVVFEWPLEGSSARGSLRAAELQKRRLRLEERNLENQILVEVREAVRAIKTNEKRIEATRRARVLAEEQLAGEMSRRQQGLSTTFRVLEMQEDVAAARSNEVKAMIDYNISLRRLELAEGSLLEGFAIRLKENLQPRLALGTK